MPLLTKAMQAESRHHPSRPGSNLERWLLGLVGGNTASGVDVNPDSALSSTAMLDGVRLISQDVARTPLHVYRRLSPTGREKEPARDHPVESVLQFPNPEQTAMEFREMVTSFAVTQGTGFAMIEFNGAGAPVELWPVVPHRVRAARSPRGNRLWLVRMPDGTERAVPLEQMFVVRGFTRFGVFGVDIVHALRESIGLTLATERFGSAFFGNGSNPGGVIQVPEILSDQAYNRLIQSWNEKHSGLENAHKAVLLEEGATYQQMGVPPEAAQFLETRKFQVTEVARALNLPPHKLKDLERATFSNIEEQSIDYVKGSLGPWFVRWEQAAALRMFTPSERGTYYLKHKEEALLRGDIKTRYEAYSVARQNGFMSINDVRAAEEMNPIPEGGDDYHVQVNMMRVQDLAMLETVPDTPPDPPTDDERTERRDAPPEPEQRVDLTPRQMRSLQGRVRQRRAYERLLLNVAERAVRREVGGIRTALKRAYGGRNAITFRAQLDEFYESHMQFLIDAFGPVFRAYAEVVYGEAAEELAQEPPEVDEFVEEYTQSFANRLGFSGKGQIEALVRDNPDDAEEVVEQRLNEWEQTRADKVARREAARGLGAFTLAAYITLGVTRKRVVTLGENCPYCNELRGQVVAVESPIVTKGQSIEPEGADHPMQFNHDRKHPPFHDGCDCTIVAEITQEE